MGKIWAVYNYRMDGFDKSLYMTKVEALHIRDFINKELEKEEKKNGNSRNNRESE